jgi:hypothetical protein
MLEQGTPFSSLLAMARGTGGALVEEIKVPVLVMVSEVPLQATTDFETRHASDVDGLSLRQTEALRQTPSRGLVYFLRKRESGVFTDKIGVGRTRNVDICIPNSQISKYHAFFSRSGDSGWTITDADSKNGTRVGAERLTVGVAKTLQNDTKIVAGGIEFIFYLPADFIFLCRSSFGSENSVSRAR